MIFWESSVKIRVELPRTAKRTPSQDVQVTFELLNLDGSLVQNSLGEAIHGTVQTGRDGIALIEMKFIPATYFEYYNLKYVLRKVTLGAGGGAAVIHEFFCDAGSAPCQTGGDIVPTK